MARKGKTRAEAVAKWVNYKNDDEVDQDTVDGEPMLCIPTRTFRTRYNDANVSNDTVMGYKDKKKTQRW